jgi:hypothetical protein
MWSEPARERVLPRPSLVDSSSCSLRRNSPPAADGVSCEADPGEWSSRAGQLTTETVKIDGPGIPKLIELQERPRREELHQQQMIVRALAGSGMIPGGRAINLLHQRSELRRGAGTLHQSMRSAAGAPRFSDHFGRGEIRGAGGAGGARGG